MREQLPIAVDVHVVIGGVDHRGKRGADRERLGKGVVPVDAWGHLDPV